jgi:hypothetical protein
MHTTARLSAIATLLLLAPAWAGSASAQRSTGPSGANHELVVVNHTAQPIVEVYVTASEEKSWGDNRLGHTRVAPGQSTRIRLGAAQPCSFDVRVVYQDGRTEDRRDLDACHMRQAVFEASVAARLPTAAEKQPVIITNHASLPIQELYVSPSTSGDWGDDLLGHQVIDPGAQASVSHDSVCVADLRVVFSNLAGEDRRRIDICEHSEIVIQPGWTTSSEFDLPSPQPKQAESLEHHT